MTHNGDAAVRLDGARKTYGEVVAVDRVDLDILEDEFFTLLGPSGSGKTTCLRMIAGFERPDEGRVELGGRDVTDLPPYERDVNTVFQDYALFPHMTVGENVRVRAPDREGRQGGAPAARHARRSSWSAWTATRTAGPAQLSGGQRQRVALARALVNRPRVLLLDEPLGALDLKLRQQMQHELRTIQGEVGITFVYVTHDQEEALTMSDRLAVFADGRIEQVGPPAEVYEHPANEFVAGFVGVSNIVERDGRALHDPPREGADPGRAPSRVNGLRVEEGRIRDVSYVGMVTRFVVELDEGGELQVVRQNLEMSSQEALEQRGRRVRVGWHGEHAYAIPDSQEAIPEEGRQLNDWRWWSALAVLTLALAALTAAGCGDDDDDGGGGGGGGDESAALQKVGKGEGEVNLIAWAGYVEDGSTDPAVDWVSDFEKETGCQVNVKIGNTSDEMVTLMRTGQVRRRVGVGRRHAAADRRRRRRSGQHRPDPELRGRLRGPEGPAAQHRRRRELRRRRTAAARTS